MEHSKKMELLDQMIAVTAQGPVSGWVNRLGEIAMALELPMEFIKWNDSPRLVAMAIISYCAEADKKAKKFEKLDQIIADLNKDILGEGVKDLEPEDINVLPEGTILVGTDRNGRPQVYAFFDNKAKAAAYVQKATVAADPAGGRKFREESILRGCSISYVYNIDEFTMNPEMP